MRALFPRQPRASVRYAVVTVLAALGTSCDFSEAEKRFLFGYEFTYGYTATDSSGTEVATGSLRMKIDPRVYGCSTSRCGDVSGRWEFAPSGPRSSSHPVGAGNIKGKLNEEFRVRFQAGPDSLQRSAVVEFEMPYGPEVQGTWAPTDGETGGAVVLREEK